MTYSVKFLDIALDDIQDAVNWYNQQTAGLGRRFTGAVRSKVKLIRENPFLFAKRYQIVHTAVLSIFPFMIHFEIILELRLVVITGVVHKSLNPEIWKRVK
ncbi:hypothetical protein DYBT9623_04640 [Dyadobacter sp. CECT 9623]|uniref:Plasmid stabilization system n=1 Tax=Dyadobacter linearis TaxID=2823330 RepID=A0ABM8UWA8_9BACT|nr:type II toxin-antitoxin system RelE/ParE family toxin [Dyadobacter sp. CECT 9623]CAG5073135.1 hypothetical protein DYBT9623_04640 [Dyadobacter sp. CECT 9623]